MLDMFVLVFSTIGNFIKILFELKFYGNITYGHIFVFFLILSIFLGFLFNRGKKD